MGGKSKAQTIGYKYYLGMHHVMCHGPVDKLTEIKVDDRLVWGGSNTGGTINVDAPTIFGGDSREGGVSGPVDILMGAPAQGQNAYLVGQIGADIPAYRGVLSAVLRQCYLGNNPYLKAWRYRATRIHKRQNGITQWNDSKAEILSAGSIFSGNWEYQVLPYHANPGTTNLAIPSSGWDNSAPMPFGNDVWSYPSPALSVIWARKTITNVPAKLKIQIRADNGCLLWINGAYIGGSNVANANIDDNSQYPVEYVVPAAGTYEIVIKAFTESSTGPQAGNYLNVTLADLPNPDMNPIHIIRECLTDPDWGMGYPEEEMGDTFATAANTIYNEGLGMSLLWDRQIKIEEFIAEVCKHIDATIYVSRVTGKFEIKLIRNDYNPATLLHLNESNIKSISDPTRTAFGELVNSVTVNYWDTATGKDASLTVTDTAMVQQQGAPINTTVQYPGFTNSRNASLAAQRDLRSLSNPSLSCQITATSVAKGLNIGDVFKFSWGKWQVANMVMRVTEIAYGTGRNNQVRITCTQDIFGTPDTLVITPTLPTWNNPSQPPTAIPLGRQVAFEAPYLELVQASGQGSVDSTLAGEPETGYVMAAAARPTSAINARMWLDSGAGYENAGSLDFCPSAVLTTAVDKLETEFHVNGMDNIDEVEIGSHCQIGDELVRIDAINTGTGVITVGRGVLDTVPQEHDIGEVMLFWDLFSGYSPTTYVAGEEVDVKITPATGMGELPLDDAPAETVVMSQRAFSPYPPGDLRINGIRYEADAEYDAELTINWAHRDRQQQTSGVYADALDGDIGPEVGTKYRVQGYIDDILVHTEDDIEGTEAFVTFADGGNAKVEVHSKRLGVYSWQAPSHSFTYTTEVVYPQYVPIPGGPLGEEDAGLWTTYAGSGPTVGGGAYVVSASASRPWWGQVVDIPSKYWDDIDAGKLKFNGMWRPASWSGDSDMSCAGVDCLAEDYTYLGGRWRQWTQGTTENPNTADQDIFSGLVPPGTRKFRWSVRGYRATGTELSAYIGDFYFQLDVSGYIVEPLYAIRGGVVADWPDETTGSRQWSAWGDWPNIVDETGVAQVSSGALGNGVGASHSASQVYANTELSAAAQAALAAGTLNAFYGAWMGDNQNEENARRYIQTRTSTTQVAIADTGVVAVRKHGRYDWLEQIPIANTVDNIRFGFQGNRAAGSYADSWMNYVYLGVYYPAP